MNEYASSLNYFDLCAGSSVFKERKVRFRDISTTGPFLDEKKVITIADLDGVFLEYGKRDNFNDNVERFIALTKIAKSSEEVIFWSARTVSNRFDLIPFISSEKIDRLTNLVLRSNQNCKVTVECGISKLFSGNNVVKRIKDETNENKNVVLIGSSIFDRNTINKASKEILNNRENLYYFDTGHVLI